ncbi:hypothetical protein Tco_0290191 [Tanacetum coccineum]
MTVCAQPAMPPVHSARVAEAMALSDSSFCKMYRSSYKIPSTSSTLPVRKRYRGTSELILDTHSEGGELGDEDTNEDGKDESSDADDERERSEDEGPGLEGRGEEAVPGGEPLGIGYRALRHLELGVEEDQVPITFEVGQSSRPMPEQQRAERVSAFRQPTLTSWVDSEDGRVYTDIQVYVPPVAPCQTPSSPEWSSGSLPILPSSPVVPSLIASLVATPTATISVDEDQFIEIGAQLELYESILQDHTQRLDALPPILFVDIDRDVRELYTRSGAVRDEIFLQRYMFRSLEREQERVAVTFGALWRPVLALEAWAERRGRLEMADCVARMERRQETKEE